MKKIDFDAAFGCGLGSIAGSTVGYALGGNLIWCIIAAILCWVGSVAFFTWVGGRDA